MVKIKLLTFFSFLVFSSVGVSMSVFSAEKVRVVLFSPMEGVLTYNGKPAEGATLERIINFDDDELTDVIEVNSDGAFAFDRLEKDLALNPLNQLVIKQKIFANFNGERHQIWFVGKMNKVEFGELGFKPSNVTCELTDEMTHVDAKSPMFVTSCKWD